MFRLITKYYYSDELVSEDYESEADLLFDIHNYIKPDFDIEWYKVEEIEEKEY